MRIKEVSYSNYNYKSQQNRKQQPSFKRVWEEHISWGANYLKDKGKTNFKLFTFPDAKAVFVEVTQNAKTKLTNMWERFVNIKHPENLAAAGSAAIAASILPLDDTSKLYPMESHGEGVFELNEVDAKPNDGYRFVIVKNDGTVTTVKDPYSKRQETIHSWSSVYDQDSYQWKNIDWLEGKDSRRIIRKPNEPMRGLDKLIIDEINIPTLSQEGTFEKAKSRIDEIAKRNIATAIEIMPVENTFSLQWGYDGVDKFAAHEKMGGPDKLKELIDYAHGKGLNVIMDMVPNHMGPDGDYLAQTGPYEQGSGEFGALFNFEGNNNRYVRDWMTNIALWWADEFKVDGIRFDLTGKAGSDWLLRQLVVEINEHKPDVFLIAEDHRKKLHSVTNYHHNPNATHEQVLGFIDTSVENITNGWWTIPWSIGFDSEWDSEYKEALVDLVLTPSASLLDKFDNHIKSSDYRVKYGYSHDEIGNRDGTRFIPKFLVASLDLFNKVYGASDPEKGQKAAHVAQKLAELIVSDNFEHMDNQQVYYAENNIGLNGYISHYDLENVFKTAIAKQKLILGTVLTTPGPKMYFQGDDEADLSYFKYFRELSNEKSERENNPEFARGKIAEKGYDPLEKFARADSIVGRIKPQGMFKDLTQQMISYNADLRNLLEKYPTITKGDIVSTYKDINHNVHIHQIKYGNDEILVIKNFGPGFHKNSYEYFGFPQYGRWEQIFSSDEKEYGGMGYTNTGRNDITNINQHLSMAPNSFLVLRKVD